MSAKLDLEASALEKFFGRAQQVLAEVNVQ